MSALAGIHAATRYRSNHQKDWRIKNSATDRSAVIIRKDHCTDRGNEEKTVELRGGQVGVGKYGNCILNRQEVFGG